MNLQVECDSGPASEERPLRFRLDGREYAVETVLDRWYEPQGVLYKLRADDGNLYILRQQTSTSEGVWDLISFRKA